MPTLYPLKHLPSQDDTQKLLSQDPGRASSRTSLNPSPIQALGKPTTKKRLHLIDFWTVLLSLTCLALSIACVADERFSWHLGQGNNQLIVIGFLLSIMNLCLASVAPTLFLLLEAEYGPSRLQNYDGILRNQFLASRLSLVWRVTLGLMVALPIGLSVAYKRFVGGESAMRIDPPKYLGNTTYGGFFAPPGVQSIGQKSGVGLFFNATLPYSLASTPDSETAPEPGLPKSPTAYGFNVLFLNENSTAMLDIPQPSYVSAVQALLANGESWNVTAPVMGTVATYNVTRETDVRGWNDTFLDACVAAQESSGAYSHQSMLNDWAVDLVDHPSPGPQQVQYIGVTPDYGIDYESPCWRFSLYAYQYDITRQSCYGTWSVTRGGILLRNGSCASDSLPETYQEPIVNNNMFLGVWYMQSLMEFLGPLATWRNGSDWTKSYYATSMAAMLWSRITVLDGAANDNEPGYKPTWTGANGNNYSLSEAGIMYQLEDDVYYIRPTLRKSRWLYLMFVIQPFLMLVILGLRALLIPVPLDKGFGLVSILAGVDRTSLDGLAGATLSGELTRDVKLLMDPVHDEPQPRITYCVVPPGDTSQRLGIRTRKLVYH